MTYCDLCNCEKRDCIYHYKNAPWGEIIKVQRMKNAKDTECKAYKTQEE